MYISNLEKDKIKIKGYIGNIVFLFEYLEIPGRFQGLLEKELSWDHNRLLEYFDMELKLWRSRSKTFMWMDDSKVRQYTMA